MLERVGLVGLVRELLEVGASRRLFEIDGMVFRKLVLEFLVTFSFNQT